GPAAVAPMGQPALPIRVTGRMTPGAPRPSTSSGRTGWVGPAPGSSGGTDADGDGRAVRREQAVDGAALEVEGEVDGARRHRVRERGRRDDLPRAVADDDGAVLLDAEGDCVLGVDLQELLAVQIVRVLGPD